MALVGQYKGRRDLEHATLKLGQLKSSRQIVLSGAHLRVHVAEHTGGGVGLRARCRQVQPRRPSLRVEFYRISGAPLRFQLEPPWRQWHKFRDFHLPPTRRGDRDLFMFRFIPWISRCSLFIVMGSPERKCKSVAWHPRTQIFTF